MKNPLRSHAPVLAIGAIAISLSAAGTVTAKALIDGSDIKNESITSKDLRDRSVLLRDVALSARRSLQGADWSSGAGAPTPGKGRSGDWYLDTTTGDAYERRTSGWERRVNLAGAIGPAGPTGSAGATGAAGDRGAAGTRGETGSEGAAGPRGATGPEGADGDDGPRGATGPRGADGSAGERGATGPQGAPGKDGERGKDGATGPQGAPGKDGERGKDGATGPQGAPGKDGERGKDGATGPQGDPGEDGAAGPRGATGTTGPQGAEGKPGPRGEAGSTGPQGPTGDDGARGATGTTGATGARGTRWLKGAGAPDAATGAEGDWYLSTASFDAYERTPTGWQPVVNLRGPAGKDGAKGADGNTILSGAGAPASTVGREGDYYLDTTATKLYGPKTTAWGPGVSLVGPAGGGGSAGVGAKLLVQAQVTAEQDPPLASSGNLPAPLTFGGEIVDTGDSWNGTTFKAPSDGLYLVQAQTVSKDAANPSLSIGHYLQLDVNGQVFGDRTVLGAYPVATAANFPAGFRGRGTFNGTVSLAAGETIQISALNGNSATQATVDDRPLSRITIIRVG